MKHEKFIRLKPMAAILRKLNPEFSTCHHCGVPWSHAEPHDAHYTTKDGQGCGFFAVCEYCYQTMTDEELIQEYEDLWNITWYGRKKPLSYVAFRSVYMKDVKARHK